LQHIGALLGEELGELCFLAGLQDQDPVAVQPISNDLISRFTLPSVCSLDPAPDIGARAR
jgi:hypothetical protein